jgi:allophanate hydrolase subunit 1
MLETAGVVGEIAATGWLLGVTDVELVDGELVPMALVAVTDTVYFSPLFRPVIVAGLPVVVMLTCEGRVENSSSVAEQ